MSKTQENYLDYVFSHSPSYSFEVNENGLVTILRENKGIINSAAQKLLNKPKVSQIHLERFGSFIWLQIDGKRTVCEIGSLVRDRFQDEAEPLYERLSVYMKQLSELGYIKRVKS